MEPFSLATGYLSGKLTAGAESLLRTHVIERWTRRRAVAFFETFVQAVTDPGASDEEVQEQLDAMMKDEDTSELLFDAYRSVALTKSKSIGPRVIALVVAGIVGRNGKATVDEEKVLIAAEELLDAEFLDLVVWVKSSEGRRLTAVHDSGGMTVDYGSDTVPTKYNRHAAFFARNQGTPLGPVDLVESVGTWAQKLSRLGLVSPETRESLGSGRDLYNQDETVRYVSRTVRVAPAVRSLRDLAVRVGVETCTDIRVEPGDH